jgi:hypothetical protein
MAIRPRPLKPGDAITAAHLNWNADQANRWGGMEVSAPLELMQTPGGPLIRLARPQGWYALLSAESPPGTYSAAERLRDPATSAWVAGPRSTSTAIEVNGGTGLAGTVQWLTPGVPGEMLFQAIRMGGYVGPTPLTNCSQVPRTDLVLSFGYRDTFAGVDHSVTLTLTYVAGTTPTWSISGVTLTGYFGTHSFTLGCGLAGGVLVPVFTHGVVDSFGNIGSVSYTRDPASTASPFLFDGHMPGSAAGTYFSFNPNEDRSVVVTA